MDVLQNNIKWCIKHNDYYVRDFINMVDDVLRLIYRLHKPVTDWLETLPHSSDGLNM